MHKKRKVKFINRDQNLFYKTVRENVHNYFVENNLSTYANGGMVIKSIVLLLGYIVPFFLILFLQLPLAIAFIMWFFMGVCQAGIGMSVMHDANHGAYAKNRYVNVLLGHTINLFGGAVFNWKLQHNILHHTYTNIKGLDDDINVQGGLRFTPHDPHIQSHRFQFIYAFFLYGLITLYWVIAKDFIQYFEYRKLGVNADTPAVHKANFFRMIVLKALYFGIFLAVPVVVSAIPFWQVALSFFIMHFTAGVILSVVFQLAHTVEGTTYPLPDDKGNIENCWAIHQMNTTVNFARNNKLLSWYVGGLNFQVEHHLFPKICHIHYPEIAPIIKRTAEEFNIPYLENRTFLTALRSHINILRSLGRLPSLNTIID